MYNDYCQTPIGTVQIDATAKGISALKFVNEPAAETHSCDLIKRCINQLNDYFAHKLFQFTLPFDLAGTAFQQSVWNKLATLSYGVTSSYSDIANSLQKPKALRAVGSANSKNPVAILLPCHRVIGSNGHLTGYAWGVDRKRWLLEHEGIVQSR